MLQKHVSRFILSIVVVLTGCGPGTKQIMESWRGSHISSLIRSWGPSQHIAPDGAGGKIYIWSREIDLLLSKGTSETNITYNSLFNRFESETTYTPPEILEVEKARMFWVNSDGIIYHWHAKGFITPDTSEIDSRTVVVFVGITAVIVGIMWWEYNEESKRIERIFGDY